MSLAHRRTSLVSEEIEKLVAEGQTMFRPGDVASRLRAQNQPLGVWEIRGEFANLEAQGVIQVDAASGQWKLAPQKSRKAG